MKFIQLQDGRMLNASQIAVVNTVNETSNDFNISLSNNEHITFAADDRHTIDTLRDEMLGFMMDPESGENEPFDVSSRLVSAATTEEEGPHESETAGQ